MTSTNEIKYQFQSQARDHLVHGAQIEALPRNQLYRDMSSAVEITVTRPNFGHATDRSSSTGYYSRRQSSSNYCEFLVLERCRMTSSPTSPERSISNHHYRQGLLLLLLHYRHQRICYVFFSTEAESISNVYEHQLDEKDCIRYSLMPR